MLPLSRFALGVRSRQKLPHAYLRCDPLPVFAYHVSVDRLRDWRPISVDDLNSIVPMSSSVVQRALEFWRTSCAVSSGTSCCPGEQGSTGRERSPPHSRYSALLPAVRFLLAGACFSG